jgi:uncharacterized protein YlxW (UPF0749 family)
VSAHLPENLLDRLIADAQADDYTLAAQQHPGGRSGRWLTLVLCGVIGLLFAAAGWQWQTVQPSAQERRADLIARIDDAGARAEQEQVQATELRASVSQLQELATSGLGEDFTTQLRAVEIASGFVGLEGPGAVLVMDDAVPPLPSGVEPDEAKVLDLDVQTAVNGLWEAGAAAIAINDIRLTSVTAIRTAGEAILVDYRPLEPPYRIAAVGPADLADRFAAGQTSDELVRLGREYGIQSEVTAAEQLQVPASTANLPTKAEVVKGTGE